MKDWFDRAARYFRSLRARRRKRIAMDEKVIHLPEGDAYLWAAVDLGTGEVIALLVSWGRSCLEAFARAGFDRWTVVAFGPRSAIERHFSLVDHRYRAFWERFPFRSTTESLLRWSEAFGGGSEYAKELILTVS